MSAHQVDHLGELVFPPDQLRNRLRHISRRKRSRIRRLGTQAGAIIAALRQSQDLADELVAASGYRADHLAVAAQGGSQGRDVGLQIVFLDDPAGPYPCHQRVLADDGAACLDQRQQDIKRAPAQLSRLAVDEELAAMRQNPEPPEPDARR